MYRHNIERADGRPSGDGWQVQEGSTYLESIASIKYLSIDCIQGVAIRHIWLPAVIGTTQWPTQGKLACIIFSHDIWTLYIGHEQGLEMRHGGIPAVVRAMVQQVRLWDVEIQLIDSRFCLMMVEVRAESDLVHCWVGTWGYTEAFIVVRQNFSVAA